MDEKGDFLVSIRGALGFAARETRTAEQCRVLFQDRDDSLILERIRYRTHVEKQALLQIFQENAENLNLDVHPVDSFRAAADTIVAIIKRTDPEFSKIKQIIQHDHPEIAELQLWKRLAGEAIQVHTAYPVDKDVIEKSKESYIGITVPDMAVAESATIVQLTGPGRPRSTSLLPTIHIALIRLKHMLADLSEVYALLRKESPRESFVFITGPSKTADIEAHMVHGAHGPREVHVVVVDEQMIKDTNHKGSGIFPSD